MRNVAARVTAVGGRVEIRSEPGAGTTVEGSAPLRPPEPEPAEAADGGPGFRPGAAALMTPACRCSTRSGTRCGRPASSTTAAPAATALRELAERVDEPLRVAVGGPPGAGSTTLVDALRAALEADRVKARADQPTVRLIDTSGAGHTASTQKILVHGAGPAALADASVLLLRHRRVEGSAPGEPPRHRSALTIGVLARVDELGAVGSTGRGHGAGRAGGRGVGDPARGAPPLLGGGAGGRAARRGRGEPDRRPVPGVAPAGRGASGDLATVPATASAGSGAAGPVRPSPTKRPRGAAASTPRSSRTCWTGSVRPASGWPPT